MFLDCCVHSRLRAIDPSMPSYDLLDRSRSIGERWRLGRSASGESLSLNDWQNCPWRRNGAVLILRMLYRWIMGVIHVAQADFGLFTSFAAHDVRCQRHPFFEMQKSWSEKCKKWLDNNFQEQIGHGKTIGLLTAIACSLCFMMIHDQVSWWSSASWWLRMINDMITAMMVNDWWSWCLEQNIPKDGQWLRNIDGYQCWMAIDSR